ncbi:uncharacterized protein LOC118436252 [Folsomia candida]|nr:uncharacterized protein LOC118436252 [Folsomia candida]
MLSANARQTMRNLDVCIQAAYLDTPFVHRLERPLIKFEGGPTPAPGEETGGGGGGDAAPPPVPPPAARRRRQTKAYIDLAKSSSEYMGDNSNSISDNGTPDDGNSTDGVRNKPVMLNSTAIFSLEQIGLSESGWCFQTEAEQRLGVLNYIRTTCPGSPASHQFSQLPSNSTGEAGDEAGEARPWDYKDEEGDQDVESSSQSSQNPGSESSADGGVTNTEPPPTTPATEE